jgi:hypothetical protein
MHQERSDSVFYFTLIDFLIQLLFFGIFIASVLIASGGNKDEPSWQNSPWVVEILDGFGPLMKESNLQLFRDLAKIIKSQEDLESLVRALKAAAKRNEENAHWLRIIEGTSLEDAQRAIGGLGKKSCLDDGTRFSLFTFEAYDSFVRLTEVSDKGHEESRKLGFSPPIGLDLPVAEVPNIFRVFYNDECTYIVRVKMLTDSNRVRRAIEANFLGSFVQGVKE